MRISANGIHVERISLPRMAWLLVAWIMLWHLCYISSDSENRTRLIQSDGGGYYAYLPAVFIYHDLTYAFCDPFDSSEPNALGADSRLFLNRTSEGKPINKYFIGTAVLESPFFFVACATASLFGYETDGYSFPFQAAVALAAIFYTLLGLEQVRRLLNKRGLPEYVQAITILLLFLGTNLYQYTMDDPGMSHAFSFAMIALFLNVSHHLFHDPKKNAVLWTAVAFTAVVIIRPVNGIVVFALPLVAGSWKNFTGGLRFAFKNVRPLLLGAGVFAFVVFLQLLIYKLTVGHWFADSYSGERLDFTNVYFHQVLFSWRRGLLVYTPLMIFSLAGIFFLKSHFERIAFACYVLIALWVIGSWQQWWYGGGLGMRPFIDHYAVMTIPLALFVHAAFRKWRTLIGLPVFTAVVMLNLIQHYQYAVGILPYDEMTEERYKRLFLKTSDGYRFMFDPGTLAEHTMPDEVTKVSYRMRTFEEDTTWHDISYWEITNEKSFEGKNAVKLDSTCQLTAGLNLFLKDAVPDSTLWNRTWVRVRSKVFLTAEESGPCMGISFRSDGREYNWQGCPLFFKTDTVGSWADFQFDVKLPPPPPGKVDICIFLLHGDSSVAYADNMEMEFWVEK